MAPRRSFTLRPAHRHVLALVALPFTAAVYVAAALLAILGFGGTIMMLAVALALLIQDGGLLKGTP